MEQNTLTVNIFKDIFQQWPQKLILISDTIEVVSDVTEEQAILDKTEIVAKVFKYDKLPEWYGEKWYIRYTNETGWWLNI